MESPHSEGPEPATDPPDEGWAEGSDGSLARAHEQRTRQVYEARGALAEAVAALTTELGERRRASATLRQENAALREERDTAVADNRALRAYVAALEQQLRQAHERTGLLGRALRSVRRRTTPE
jgi:predicted RNase H-like nuclease (RuvC/YqgF family)